ncbi:MAG: DnaB-like helicase N-terminal domain-containing protein, partial [Hyphomicrobium sp.]
MANPAFLLTEKLREAASAEEPLTFRQAPHNLEAEQALLGAILVNNEALDRVSGFLLPGHFYD